MVKININYLHDRRDFIEMIIHSLCKIKDENKKQIRFTISTSRDVYCWLKYRKILEVAGIETDVFVTHNGFNYMDKINRSVNSGIEYTMKLDEDIYMNEHLFDYMIENVDNVLNDKNNLLFTPLLSCGIPSVDMFINDFFDKNDVEKLNTIFQLTTIPDSIWGCNYEFLNDYTIRNSFWDSAGFYNAVKNMQHHYKGIHPVRTNWRANCLLNDMIWQDLNKITKQNKPFYIQNTNVYPYICNSVFIMKTEIYKDIVNTPSLFRDPFDEVPINIYKQMNNLNFSFVRNGFGIHFLYNSVPNYLEKEMVYYNKLMKNLENK